MMLGIKAQYFPTHTIIGNAAYVAFGLILALGSKPLRRLIAQGLE
jgi:hypothetical protein